MRPFALPEQAQCSPKLATVSTLRRWNAACRQLCLDGRRQNVNFAKLKHRNLANIRFEQFKLETDFSCFGRFDLLINFGMLYHLRHVDAHLKTCFGVADDILLESVVCDSSDPQKILLRAERAEIDDEALDGIGSRPSPFYIERLASEAGFDFTRFTAALNFGASGA